MLRSTLVSLLLVVCLVSPLTAGTSVRVSIHGDLFFNGVAAPPLGNAQTGPMTVTFLLDTDQFLSSPNFPVRGYVIDEDSFEVQFTGGTVVGIQNPFAGTPYFVIRDNDPGVDGFYLTTNNPDFPLAVALEQNGGFGAFKQAFEVTYGGSTLPSLDLIDAVGSYDFTGLSVFHLAIEDGPFQAMNADYSSMEIEVEGGPWTDEGCALAGAAGDPVLVGSGSLAGGSGNAFDLSNAAPGATSGLFVGLASNPTPFKGGTLKPVPFFGPLILPTSGVGGFTLPFVMPAGVPSGTELYAQWAIQDAGAVLGVALSNAIRGVTP